MSINLQICARAQEIICLQNMSTRQQLANIVISCPDKPGIVKTVTTFLYDHGANISLLEEHVEDGHFFMRVEWEQGNNFKTAEDFTEAFEKLRNEFEMTVEVDFNNKKKRLILFCSKELHCLVDILGRYAIKELDVEIPCVISNSEEAEELVKKFGIPFYYVESSKKSLEYENEMLKILANHPSDFIGLARYMKVLSANFIKQAGQKIINVHHSFLPSFVGAKPYEEAYERGVKLIGASAHYVTPELDQGPIIEQDVKRIRHSHEISKLKLIGREIEKQVFSFAIKKHIENKLIIYKNRTIVFE